MRALGRLHCAHSDLRAAGAFEKQPGSRAPCFGLPGRQVNILPDRQKVRQIDRQTDRRPLIKMMPFSPKLPSKVHLVGSARRSTELRVGQSSS